MSVLLGLVGVAMAQDVVLEADSITLDGEAVEGTGHVRVERRGEVVTGRSFSLDSQAGTLTVRDGSWTRDGQELGFQQLVVDLDEETVAIVEGTFSGRDGRLRITGEQILFTDAQHLQGQRFVFTTCDCERPTWEVEAERVDVTLGDQATFRKGRIRICEVPLIPVPVGAVPLAQRRSGLLVPRLSWGQDGVVASVPYYRVTGPLSDVTLEPELRQERGARVLAEGRYWRYSGKGLARASGGFDTQVGRLRGGLDVEQGWAEGRLRTGVDAQLVSDEEYLSDYGDSYLSRSLPWSESLAVLGWGPLRLESDAFQAADAVGQRPLAGVLQASGLALGPVAASVGARLDVVGEGEAPWAVAGSVQRFETAGTLTWGTALGPVEATLGGQGRALSWVDGQPWGEGQARVRAVLPAWADYGAVRHVVEVGLEASAAGLAGDADVRLLEDAPADSWTAGPVLASRWLTSQGFPVSAWAAVPYTPGGLSPRAALRAAWDHAGAEGYGEWSPDRFLWDGSAWWDSDAGRIAAGAVQAGDLFTARGEAALSVRGWRPGYRAWLDLTQTGPDVLGSHGPSLRWTSSCDCLEVEAAATWSQDRAVPDLGVVLRVK